VHALEVLHTTLRPSGLLLDVHPAPHLPLIQAWRGDGGDGRVVPLGQVDDPCFDRLPDLDATLQTVIDAGRFALERAEEFTFINHAADIDDWLAFMAAHWIGGTISDEVVARARVELAREPGELRVIERVHTARLRRL
jgi:hypothetical protein